MDFKYISKIKRFFLIKARCITVEPKDSIAFNRKYRNKKVNKQQIII